MVKILVFGVTRFEIQGKTMLMPCSMGKITNHRDTYKKYVNWIRLRFVSGQPRDASSADKRYPAGVREELRCHRGWLIMEAVALPGEKRKERGKGRTSRHYFARPLSLGLSPLPVGHLLTMNDEVNNAGLGMHIRHDAITGDAQVEPNNSVTYSRAQVHPTVFVSANENAGAVGSFQATTQDASPQLPPSFPPPPPHPSLMSRPSEFPHHRNQMMLTTAPNVGLSLFPHPPAHPTAISHQPMPYFQPPQPPPPGLPPDFPPPNNIPSSNFDVPAESASSISVAHTQQIRHDSSHNDSQTSSANNLLQHNIKHSSACHLHPQTDVKEISDAIEKARSIARRFHVESTQRQTISNNNSIIYHDNSIPTGIDYLGKRRAHFQKEKSKFDKFRLKNLEYVMRLDEMELRQHVNCMNQITAFEEKQSIRLELAKQQQQEMQRKLEQKRQRKTQTSMMNATSGGIGSQDQQRAERVRKREHLDHGTSRVKTEKDAKACASRRRNSLYLTNLPTDGCTTERVLHSLFSSYGRLDRVTMYRDRSTGELKGDGLIVFGRDAVDAFDDTGDGDFIDSVCLQVSLYGF
jgi:hypothetical protein